MIYTLRTFQVDPKDYGEMASIMRFLCVLAPLREAQFLS